MPRRYAIQVPVLDDREPPGHPIEHTDRAAAAQTRGLDLVDHAPSNPRPRRALPPLASNARVLRRCDQIAAHRFGKSVPSAWTTQP
jgi:hypothetical protein